MTENSPQTEIIRPEEIAAALTKDQAAGKISIIDKDHLLTHPEDGTEPIEVSTEDYIRSFDRFSQAYDGVIMQTKAEFFYQSQAKTPQRFLGKPLKRPEVANILAVLSVAVLSALMFWSFVFAHPLLQSLNTPGPTALADFWGKVFIIGNIGATFCIIIYGLYYGYCVRNIATEDRFKVGIEYTPIEGVEDSIKNLRPTVINVKPTTIGQFFRVCWIFAWFPFMKTYLHLMVFFLALPWGMRLIDSI